MTVILLLSSFNGSSAILAPSILIVPLAISTILLKDKQIVLFPAPVRPTTPTFSPFFTSKVRFFKITSVLGLYFRFT